MKTVFMKIFSFENITWSISSYYHFSLNPWKIFFWNIFDSNKKSDEKIRIRIFFSYFAKILQILKIWKEYQWKYFNLRATSTKAEQTSGSSQISRLALKARWGVGPIGGTRCGIKTWIVWSCVRDQPPPTFQRGAAPEEGGCSKQMGLSWWTMMEG